ncbi:DHHC palmitoyltransferase-domain-containing protein [Mycena vitilis]|nr:DHHC palmitoyltransferase-domain-containing protein [Mycena vitilis]
MASSSPDRPSPSQLPLPVSAPRASTSSRSPVMPTFAAQYRSTHAGGVQPSASFFRPSRPQHRPPSTESVAAPTDADVYDLAPLSKQFSNSSDEPAASIAATAEDDYKAQRPKPSREPLLPLGATRPSLAPRPSMHERTGSSSTGGALSPTRSATGRLVRNSLERVFSLRRGMSFDSLRKAAAAREGRPPFEDRPQDEEHGMYDLPSPYKTSTAPGDYPSEVHRTPTASPEPSFLAPPSVPPPGPSRAAMPVLDAVTHNPLRNYEVHPSRNRFFLRGHLLTGGDSPWAFIGSLVLVLSLAGVWFGTTAVWWWHNLSPAVAAVGAYLALITLSSLLSASTRDPGILPRNLDPDPPYPTTSPSNGDLRAPMPRDLKVRADVVRVKYCPTCKTYRPPRSSHCKMCDNCVDGCDHHCQWLNNCIGRRNYTTFFVLLVSATTTLVLMIVTSAIHLYLLAHWDHDPAHRGGGRAFKHALSSGAGSAVVFCLAIMVIWPVGALLSYHMRLLLLNVTTIEQIRNQAHKTLVPGPAPPNPFSHGNWRRNLLAVLCRPVGYSWLDAPGFATQDEREVNPGFVGGKERRGE